MKSRIGLAVVGTFLASLCASDGSRRNLEGLVCEDPSAFADQFPAAENFYEQDEAASSEGLEFDDVCSDVPLTTTSQQGPRIVISKGCRRLYFFDAQGNSHVFPVALGMNGDRDKRVDGDYATPEGDFYVCWTNPRSQYRRFLALSYPNIEDAERGLREGLINRTTYRKILYTLEQGACPPSNTRLGGDIGIHGEKMVRILGIPFSVGSSFDWTRGCIALDNDDIENLYRMAPVGTRVRIIR